MPGRRFMHYIYAFVRGAVASALGVIAHNHSECREQVIKLFRQIVRDANVRGAEEANYTFITLLINDLAQFKDREAFKENDAPLQKYARYLYNLHLSKCQEAKKMSGSVQQKGCICELGLDIPLKYGDMQSKFGYKLLGVIGRQIKKGV